jgi:hypothetical protein
VAQHWLVRGRTREQRQARQPDKKAADDGASLQAESHPDRLPLRDRKIIDQRQARDQQLMHRAVLELYLRFDPGDHAYLEPSGCLHRVAGQAGLADSVTTTEHQHAAGTAPDDAQQIIDRGPLSVPVKQRPLSTRPPARRHGPRHPLPPMPC